MEKVDNSVDKRISFLETNGGWVKYAQNPVLGGQLGTCFDCSVLQEEGLFQMWFSWRPQESIAYVESVDGITWSEPLIVLGPDLTSGWETEVNRPGVVKRADGYHMWYTGQTWSGGREGRSCIGYAISLDGKNWERAGVAPVIVPELDWEKEAVMCPHVIWDETEEIYKMWYSGGEQYEPDAIGYTTSPDGKNWVKLGNEPIFKANKELAWESCKVTACQVVLVKNWYYMFYIGFADVDHARIGLARSRDGINDWERHPANPLISNSLSEDGWDHDAAYKPAALYQSGRWLLWYNGRRKDIEQIGLALHQGADFGWE